MTLQDRFHRHLCETGCIPAGSHVLVALSGGADSVALLSLLLDCPPTMCLHIEAAHLDHALRADSLQDAQFVAQFCGERKVPLVSRRIEVAAVAKEKRGNLEEVARELRREFLVETAGIRSCSLIALGHHADDQAETFMMRLLRGSGIGGLAGMRMVDGPIVRPLLSFRKLELLDYLRMRGLVWREDESNRDQGYTRNRLRHQLLPLLESFNPQIATQLAGLCERLHQDEVCWDGLVQAELASGLQRLDDDGLFSCDRLNRLPPALASRLVRAVLRDVRGDLRGINAQHVAAILGLAATGPVQGELSLPGVWVARRYDTLRLRQVPPEPGKSFELTVTQPGDYLLRDGRLLRVSLEKKSLGEAATAVEFCARSVALPLQVRCRRPGDRMRPSGMLGSKKLQDLFVDLKLTREERRIAPLVVKEEEILWVAGLRRCEGHRPEANAPVLRICIIPAP